MPRNKTPLRATTKKKIVDLVARGATAEAIAKALKADGVVLSVSTITRRMRELRGSSAPRRVSASESLRAEYADELAKPIDDDESDEDEDLPNAEAIPENADLDQIKRWLDRAERIGKVAFAKGDLAGMGQMGRLASALLEAKRKATPVDKPDPKDNPDMVKVAEEARAKLHRYIDQALGK